MSYHDLSECTLSPEERRSEAFKIVLWLANNAANALTEREQEYILSISGQNYVSVKQLFYLRDIKEKY